MTSRAIKPVAAAWRATTTCLLLAGLVLAGGCSTLSRTTLHMAALAVHGPPQAAAPTPAKVAALPYAQLGITSKAGSAVLVLGYVDHGRMAWYSASREIVFTRHGVVVKTWNLHPDVLATHLPADSPFATGLERLTAPVTTTRTLDLPDYRYGVLATSELAPAGAQDVVILGKVHHLLRIDERLRAPSIGFAADNRYWVDPASGFVWKSRQTLPGGQTLTLTVLKPYGGDGS